MNTNPLPAHVTNPKELQRWALTNELFEAVLELRRASIAPHRYSESKASLNVARLSDAIQQLD